LEEVGASQWKVYEDLLGTPVHKLLRSAGLQGLHHESRGRLDSAVAVWVQDLRVVVVNACHPALADLDQKTYERVIARTAWHEWGHALSIVRCTSEDVAAGTRLLALAPTSVSKSIREAGYRRYEYTHELVAEIYALLIERRQQEEPGRPRWLNQEIYDLVKRVTAWPD
jgi:hypothetical protein